MVEIKTQPGPRHKSVYILPNLLTTGSLLAGFVGIVGSIEGRFEFAAIAILISLVLDGLDGKVARLTHTSSEFGVQYDSLADLVAFGVGPSLLVYLWKLHEFGRLGMMAAFLFTVCGALRLARFNVQSTAVAGSSKKFFTGLPIPAAGCTLSTLILFSGFAPHWLPEKALGYLALVLAYALSYLMVSRIRYYAFKEFGFFKAHAFGSMVTVILLFVLVASEPMMLGFPMLLAYIISGLVYTFIILPRKHPRLLGESRQELS